MDMKALPSGEKNYDQQIRSIAVLEVQVKVTIILQHLDKAFLIVKDVIPRSFEIYIVTIHARLNSERRASRGMPFHPSFFA